MSDAMQRDANSDALLTSCARRPMRRCFTAIIATLLIAPAAGQQGCSAADKEALRKLYEDTHGPQWKKSTNWLEYDPCTNNWHGVLCNKAKTTIIGLNLFDNGLAGTLPTEIGLLTGMQALSVRINAISGTLPSELGLLTEMKALSAYNNRLSGTIPSELALLTKPKVCWLTEAQCRTKLDEASCFANEHRTAFRCPVPAGASLCVTNTNVTCEEEEAGKEEL